MAGDATELESGVPYPHWAQDAELGCRRATLYLLPPPLTWMLGALLGYAIPWEWVPATLTFLFLCAAGLSTRALARRFLASAGSDTRRSLASATPYAFFTTYERTAFSELAAASFIPLLLLFACRQSQIGVPQVSILRPGISQIRTALDGSTACLALVLAASWLTNAPAGVMASYLLAFAAVAAAGHPSSMVARRPRGSGSNQSASASPAFYLVPAAWEQRWIDIQQAVDVGMRRRR